MTAREHPGRDTIAPWTTDRDREGRPIEWANEPDRFEWWHVSFACLMLRNGGGEWCGYVEVTKLSVPFADGDIDGPIGLPRAILDRLTPWGGVSFHGALRGSRGFNWIGFCMARGLDPDWYKNRNMARCKREVEALAEQVARFIGAVDWDL